MGESAGRGTGTIRAGNILARGVAAGNITQAQANRFANAVREGGVFGDAANLQAAATEFVTTGGRRGGPPRRRVRR